MTRVMDICHGPVDEMDHCATGMCEPVICSLDKEQAEDARCVSIESDGTLDAISVDSSCPVTGGRSDVSEDYEILPTILGTGYYGCVRECLHRATGKKYAVKSIDKNKASRLDHIRREIGILCSVDHPGIMKMADCYEDEDFVHIVTERYTGGELFGAIVDNTTDCGCLLEGEAIKIIKSLLEAVEYLHSKDIVHRDIKPENILFESDQEGSPIKLIDFGLARVHRSNDKRMRNGVGSSYYMSPAVLKGKYDRSCDLWAVGVVAHVLLCGYPPFNGSDDYEIQMAVLDGDLVFDPAVWGKLSRESMHFVGKLLYTGSSRIRTASQALRHPWLANA